MDFSRLKDSLEEKGKDEMTRREQQLEEKQQFSGHSNSQANGENPHSSSTQDLSASSKKESREPEEIDKVSALKELVDPDETAEFDAVSDDETVSIEDAEKAA